MGIDTEATCTTEGSRHKTCSRCEDIVTETIPVEEDHEYTETVIEATCTESGYTVHTCANCGNSYTDNEIAALGHDYGEWVIDTEATCTTEGSRHKTCSRCEDVVTEIIPVDEENHVYSWHTDSAATCSAEGSKTGTCSRCGNQVVEIIPINSSKHTYGEAVILSNSTCTEMGKSQKTCQDCGYVYTYNVSLLAHVETDIDYLNNTFLCSSCNERYALARSDDFEYYATLTGYNSSGKKVSAIGFAKYFDISAVKRTLNNVYIPSEYKNRPIKLTTEDLLREFHATYIYVEDGVEIQNLAAFVYCESLQYISLPASARELNLDFTGCSSTLQVLYRE